MKKILIDGIMCSRCTEIIENKLKDLKEIKEFKVNLDNKEALVIGDINDELLKSSIESEGYKVIEIIELKDRNFSTKEIYKNKGFFNKLVDKISSVNKGTFGEGNLTCCDLNKKVK